MTSGDWLYWIGWAGVIAVNLAMVYLAWWALFADRSKGRRRCPRCWYDLSYSPGMTCAECGYTARHEKQFRRTRRRWAHAILAMMTCVVLAWFVNQRMARTGWVSLLPTRVIVLSLPLTDNTQGVLYDELGRRIFSRRFSDREWMMLVERCAEGDWWAPPPSDLWVEKYGEILSRWRDTFLPPRDERDGDPSTREYSDLERLMFDIPPRVELAAREVWPKDATPQAQLRVYDWWPRGTSLRVTLAPRLEDAEPITFFRRNTRELRAAATIPLPPNVDADQPVTFDIAVARRAPDHDKDWTVVSETTQTVTIRREGTIPDLLAPTSSDDLTEELRKIFAGRVVAWTGGRSPVRFQYGPGHSYGTVFNDLAIGVSLELRHEGELARILEIWWLAGVPGSRPMPADRGLGWEIAYENAELLRTIRDDDPRWRMFVRGDASIALRAGAAPKYWDGAFELPVQVRRFDRRAPSPEWWTNPATESADDAEDVGAEPGNDTEASDAPAPTEP